MLQCFKRRPSQQKRLSTLASVDAKRHIVILLSAVSLLGSDANARVTSTFRQTDVTGKTALLFCAYGAESFKPRGSDVLAVAVVQVSSSKEMAGVSFSDFELLSDSGSRIHMKRLLSVENLKTYRLKPGTRISDIIVLAASPNHGTAYSPQEPLRFVFELHLIKTHLV